MTDGWQTNQNQSIIRPHIGINIHIRIEKKRHKKVFKLGSDNGTPLSRYYMKKAYKYLHVIYNGSFQQLCIIPYSYLKVSHTDEMLNRKNYQNITKWTRHQQVDGLTMTMAQMNPYFPSVVQVPATPPSLPYSPSPSTP